MAILLHSVITDLVPWRDEIQRLAPELDVRIWPHIGTLEDIDVLVAWLPPDGLIESLPHLKLLQCLGAGVDQLATLKLPPHVPVARFVNNEQTTGMVQYVVAQVLRYYRKFDVYAELQAQRLWRRLDHPALSDCRVGIMGLGELGAACAAMLRQFGFPVFGWSRSPKAVDGIQCSAGFEQLDEFLSQVDILVCLLPLTPQTQGLLNMARLHRLRPGAKLINVSRGAVLIEADLIAALESGVVSAATLDVTVPEPPAADSPIWSHPRITLTPHIATVAGLFDSVPQIVENARLIHAGMAPRHLVDMSVGY